GGLRYACYSFFLVTRPRFLGSDAPHRGPQIGHMSLVTAFPILSFSPLVTRHCSSDFGPRTWDGCVTRHSSLFTRHCFLNRRILRATGCRGGPRKAEPGA